MAVDLYSHSTGNPHTHNATVAANHNTSHSSVSILHTPPSTNQNASYSTHNLSRYYLTSSHRMPFKPAISFSTGGRLNTHSVFCEFCRESCQHVTCGLDIVQDDVYTRKCFSESEETRFGGPRQKALPGINEFNFCGFCLIPLSKTCSFDVPAKNL